MQLDLSRHVNAPAEVVWEVLTDIPSAPRTLSGVLAVEILTPVPYEPGLRWKETRKMFGVKATEEMMVQESEPPYSTTIVAENGGTEYKTEFIVTPDDPEDPAAGGATLRMLFGAESAHAPAVSRVIMGLMGGVAEKSTRKTMEKDLAGIAAEAEHRHKARGRRSN